MHKSKKNIASPPCVNRCAYGLSLLLFLLTIFIALFHYAQPLRDGDIWFHLVYAEYFLKNSTLILDHSIFSWTPAIKEYIYCAWLSQLVLYFAHSVFDIYGVFLLKYLAIFLFVFLYYRFSKKLKIHKNPVVWLVCLISVVMSYSGIIGKPTLFSYIFFLFYCWIWWYYRSQENTSVTTIYLLPVIMLLWVNSHGCFVFGCLFVLLINVGELLNTWLCPGNCLSNRYRLHLFIASILTAVAICLNPYGINYPLQLFHEALFLGTNSGVQSGVGEYQSPYNNSDFLSLSLCVNISIILLVIQLYRSFRKIEWSMLLLCITFLLLYAAFYRTTFFWPLIFSFIFLTLYSNPGRVSNRRSKMFTTVCNLAISLLAIAVVSNVIVKGFTQTELYTWKGFGIFGGSAPEEVEVVKRYFPNAKIGNTYDLGSYLMWSIWPQNKVYLDARHFPYKEWLKDGLLIKNKDDSSIDEKYIPDIWLVNIRDFALLKMLNRSKNWVVAHYGKNAVLFVNQKYELHSHLSLVNENIFQQQNLVLGQMLVRWLVEIEDWDNADILLTFLEKKFIWFESQRLKVKNSKHYVNGVEHYKSADYESAISDLQNIEDSFLQYHEFYAKSYIQLSIEHWNTGLIEKSQELNDIAWDIQPNLTSLFNKGVINWYLIFKDNPNDLYLYNGTNKPEMLWRNQLSEFLKRVNNSENMAPYIEIAELMLENRFNSIPYLLDPDIN